MQPHASTDGPGFYVVYEPNPCNQHSVAEFPVNPAPFMWYYRTEVRNTTDSPLRVVWFEAYSRDFGKWEPGNITGRTLTHEDFCEWYSDENGLWEDGTIPPGGAAICDINWHGGRVPWSPRIK